MTSDGMALRPCGSSWAYCAGNCAECYNSKLTYLTATEVTHEES